MNYEIGTYWECVVPEDFPVRFPNNRFVGVILKDEGDTAHIEVRSVVFQFPKSYLRREVTGLLEKQGTNERDFVLKVSDLVTHAVQLQARYPPYRDNPSKEDLEAWEALGKAANALWEFTTEAPMFCRER